MLSVTAVGSDATDRGRCPADGVEKSPFNCSMSLPMKAALAAAAAETGR